MSITIDNKTLEVKKSEAGFEYAEDGRNFYSLRSTNTADVIAVWRNQKKFIGYFERGSECIVKTDNYK